MLTIICVLPFTAWAISGNTGRVAGTSQSQAGYETISHALRDLPAMDELPVIDEPADKPLRTSRPRSPKAEFSIFNYV